MSLTAGAPVPPKPDMQSQANSAMSVPPDTPQVQSTENRPPSLSPAELDRIFGD